MVKRQKDTELREKLRKEAESQRKKAERVRREKEKAEAEAKHLEEILSEERRKSSIYKYSKEELTIGLLKERFEAEGSNIGIVAKEYLKYHPNVRPITEELIISLCENILDTDNTGATKKKNLAALKRCVSSDPKLSRIVTDYVKPVKAKRSMFIALTDDEIKNLRKINTINPTEEAARLAFLISCFTGQRYSDVAAMQGIWHEYKVNGTYNLTYNTEKTGTQAHVIGIPAFIYRMRQKLAEMDFNARKNVSNQVMFIQAIKKVARRAGITTIMRGFFLHDKYVDIERCEVIGMHTARRTCASRMFRNGIPIEQISRMLGHTSIAITQRYIVGEITEETVQKLQEMNAGFE